MIPQKKNEDNEDDIVLLKNWISKIYIKNPTSKEETKEGTKHQRTKRHDIKGVVTKAKLQICYVRIIELSIKEKTLKHDKK